MGKDKLRRFAAIKSFENVIEANKDLLLSVIFGGQETKYHAIDWKEVKELYKLLLLEKFDEIASIIK